MKNGKLSLSKRRDGVYKHLRKPQQRDWIWRGKHADTRMSFVAIPHAQMTAFRFQPN